MKNNIGKNFLKNNFGKNEANRKEQSEEEKGDSFNSSKTAFMRTIRNIENEETRLLELQRKYESKEIDEKNLSIEQIMKLLDLYHKQIAELEKSNRIKREKILKYKKNMNSV